MLKVLREERMLLEYKLEKDRKSVFFSSAFLETGEGQGAAARSVRIPGWGQQA